MLNSAMSVAATKPRTWYTNAGVFAVPRTLPLLALLDLLAQQSLRRMCGGAVE